MSDDDDCRLVLPSGRILDLRRSRWDGVLDSEEYDYCRQHGIPVSYDPAQIGWVVSTWTDDLAEAASSRPPINAPMGAAPAIPEQLAEGLRLRAEAAAERCLDKVRAGILTLDEAERRLHDIAERTADDFATGRSLRLVDSFRFALHSHMAGVLRDLRGSVPRLTPHDEGTFRFRSWTADDVSVYVELLGNPKVWRYLPEPFPTPFTPDVARTLIELGSVGFHQETVAVVVDDQPVGQCLLRFNEPFAGVRTAEVAYWLGEKFWGRGWMSSILPAFTERSFRSHQVDVIYAWIMPDNQASIRAAERTGYRRDRWSLESRVAESLGRKGFIRYATYRADW